MKIPHWMRTLLATILAAIALFASFNAPAYAADVATGAKVFGANCAACHAGGNNVVNPAKTLKKEALEKFGKNTVDAIVAQVTKGAGAMPAFKGRLTDDQIQSVSMFVLDKSKSDWK